MKEKIPHLYQDTEGIALVVVLIVMSALFLVGMASLTNTSTEFMISQNYRKGVRALYDCEAGIAEAIAKIKNDTIVLDSGSDPNWTVTSDTTNFKYRYYTTFDPNSRIFTVTSEGKDPTQAANRRIVAELRRPFCAADIKSPVYCGSGENDGVPNSIHGDSKVITWADDGDPSNDGDAPCVTTPKPFLTATNPIDMETDQLSTTYSPKVEYSTQPIDLMAIANFCKDRPPDLTSWPTSNSPTSDDIIGNPDTGESKVVYLNESLTIAGTKKGCGILVVTGDLHIAGVLEWTGIVIVLGNKFVQTGGGYGLHVTGAALTPNNFEIRGTSDVQWSADVVKKVLKDAGDPLTVVSWKED